MDGPALQAEVQRRLSEKLGGQVSWEALEIGYLPPRAELRKLRVEIPQRLDASADELNVYLRLWPLLRGHVEISSLSLQRPRVRVQTAGGGARDEPLDAVKLYREALEPAAQALQAFASQMKFQVTGASLEIAPLDLRGLDATLKADDEGFDLELATASNFWQRLSFKGRVAYADLAARGELRLDALVVDKTLPPAALRAALRTDAKTSIDAEFDGTLGTLASAKGSIRLPAGASPVLDARLSDVDLVQALPLARARVSGLDAIESAQGKLAAHVVASAGPPWRLDIHVTRSDAAVKLAQLPAPVTLESGSLGVDAKRLRLDKVAVALLDARTLVSGTVGLSDKAVELSTADGVTGDQLVAWALERAGAPERVAPKTPLRFTARRIAWTPNGPLEVDARLLFDAGPEVALALSWRSPLLELKRVAIKDARSSAALGATVGGTDVVRASFSGTLAGASLVAMLKTPAPASGVVRGDLRLTIDRKRPARTVATGELQIEALDLSWLLGKKLLVERADLSADGTSARVRSARVNWDEQLFELSGAGRRTEKGPLIEARIESPGVALDRLLPPPDPNAPKKKSAIWPLPVSGLVEMRSGFVQYGNYRIEPFAGSLTLEPQRARLAVKEARMCGLSFPLEAEARPEETTATAHITMHDEPLERTVRCLTGDTVQLTGNANLTAELQVRGKRPHLLRSLTGTAEAVAKQGRVQKFALIGNILSFRNIAAPGAMKEEGFPYRSMTAKGRFASGEFLVEEAFFDSDAVRLAASGKVDLLGANSDLTVLVGLLTHVDRVAGSIPILGDIFGGSMLALPVQVSGDIRDPRVVPLGPRAVTHQLLGIFERTLKLPGKLAVPPEAKP